MAHETPVSSLSHSKKEVERAAKRNNKPNTHRAREKIRVKDLRMGRPPCCEMVGIKKGPWTPEEDIILVSYIQEHGPGNWRSVPTNTGLMRCSKSCRLRWTNYLRPGIRRGNFTRHEEGIIIHLQSLLGNRWAAIASYLPQRTDNDIKNYWNTHLKKKIKKNHSPTCSNNYLSSSDPSSSTCHDPTNTIFKTQNIFDEKQLSSTSTSTVNSALYASSTENISKLLQGFMNSTPKVELETLENEEKQIEQSFLKKNETLVNPNCLNGEENEPLVGFETDTSVSQFVLNDESEEIKQRPASLSLLEKWLFDETSNQMDLMDLSADMF
ncbi:hypothetical protein LUZ60_015497 [Juncus effusus]|nr:hypothetical protein LUZ60_015497 [Juncus effusus]